MEPIGLGLFSLLYSGIQYPTYIESAEEIAYHSRCACLPSRNMCSLIDCIENSKLEIDLPNEAKTHLNIVKVSL